MQTPQAAIAASARLLRNLVRQFGNLGLAAAAYNAGPRRIQDWLARKGKLPEETQHYVKTITGRPAENWKAAKAASSVQNVPRQAPCQEATGLIASNEPQRADVATRSRAMLPHVKAPAYRSAGVRAVPPS
ncbi:MAG: lytic transglycosylase domain-containing protein [Pseudolabrys sp.]